MPKLEYPILSIRSFLARVVEHIGQVAFATVLAVVHSSHKDTSTALYDILAS